VDGVKYAFTGREWDPETGLYYYRARYLDPKVGRFISEDPIGLAGGVNSYSYVAANPVNAVDPAGLFKFVLARGYKPDEAHADVIERANTAQEGIAAALLKGTKDLFKDFYGADEKRLLQLLGPGGPTMELTQEGGMGWVGSCVNGVPRMQAQWLYETGKDAVFQAGLIHELAHYLAPWYHALFRPSVDKATANWWRGFQPRVGTHQQGPYVVEYLQYGRAPTMDDTKGY
jgi:RHS repeat-associated protein